MNIKNWIQTAGFNEGLRMWYFWEIKAPIQELYWETFKTRTYCQWAGWHCQEENCTHTHTKRRPRKEDYPIKEGDMCDYCGEEPPITHTHNPNLDQKPYLWKVCKACEELIPLQEQQSMSANMIMNFPTEKGKDQAEKIFEESCDKIAEFEARTGKKTFSSMITTIEGGEIISQELKIKQMKNKVK